MDISFSLSVHKKSLFFCLSARVFLQTLNLNPKPIAYLLSSSSKKKSTTTHGGKSIFWERIPAFHFLKRDLSTVGGVLYRLKSRVLSFFFLDCRNM